MQSSDIITNFSLKMTSNFESTPVRCIVNIIISEENTINCKAVVLCRYPLYVQLSLYLIVYHGVVQRVRN